MPSSLTINHHRLVTGIRGVLFIDYSCHPQHGLRELIFGNDTMMQPVGNVLAGDSERCSVFHEPHIVDVGHFLAAHTVINPADYIAQHALHVVIELALDFLG